MKNDVEEALLRVKEKYGNDASTTYGIPDSDLIEAAVVAKVWAMERRLDSDVTGKHVTCGVVLKLFESLDIHDRDVAWSVAAEFIKTHGPDIDAAVWGHDYDLE